MNPDDENSDPELHQLRERAKELRCLYRVGEAVAKRSEPPQAVFAAVLDAIPPAWQHPEVTTARIEYLGRSHARPDFVETPWRQRSPILVFRTPIGALEVLYVREQAPAFEGPFLREERELLDTIAQRLGEYLEWKHRELGGERIGAAPEHWRWRQRIAERLVAELDPARFGVTRAYLHGSTEEGTAGAESDIDLLLAFDGTPEQRRDLGLWLEGWDLCLAEVSFQLHGIPSRGLLDVHIDIPERIERDVRAAHAAGAPLRELPLLTRI
jgi:hypothetical protein